MKATKTSAELPFETSLEKLENIVKKLESGELSLEDSIKAFEEGVTLSSYCNKKLEEAQKKVEILLNKDGSLVKEPFQS